MTEKVLEKEVHPRLKLYEVKILVRLLKDQHKASLLEQANIMKEINGFGIDFQD